YAPPKGPGVRVDDGMEEGMDIPIYYDPMIAKLVTYGADRTEAIQRMIRAIDDYKITGVQTTLEFCRFVMQHNAFVSGKFDTHFVNQHFKPEMLKREQDNEEQLMIAAISAVALLSKKEKKTTPVVAQSNGKAFSNWRKRREN
ncbi:MAG TPA: biotin carboxylase, partial [Bacteroidia bacterium]|nr:biotin carboxylase [Bacteroidia bacterium]